MSTVPASPSGGPVRPIEMPGSPVLGCVRPRETCRPVTDAEQRQPRFSRDIRIAALLFVVAACLGMVYVSAWDATPSFCQEIFGPAVMLAYGRGYVNPDLAEAPKLEAFLYPDMHTYAPPAIDSFAKEDLPEGVGLKPFSALQRRQLYLLWSAAAVWAVFGVAWSALTPLYGLLYGLAGAASYGLFRLAMNRVLAVFCAVLLIVSPIQLQNLVRLRDYSKAPFMFAAIFLIGLLIKKPMKWPSFLGCAAACGAVVGIGLGFRFDVFICIGAFAPVVLFFVPGNLVRRLPLNIAALGVFLLVFVATSWPVLTALRAHGDKCHPALMGFAQLYDDRLGVDADYQLAHRFLDSEPMAIIHAYASHVEDAVVPAKIETPEYERLGEAFYTVVLKTFPADLVVRAYAAVLRILDELRAGSHNAVPRGITNQFVAKLFEVRAELAETVFSRSRYAVLLVLVLLAARDFRVALASLFLLLFLGGYTANQFASRNYFYLEWFSLWAGGFLLMQAFLLAKAVCSTEERRALWQHVVDKTFWIATLKRVGAFGLVAVVGLAALLWPLRLYQSVQVHRLFKGYTTAELEPLPIQRAPGAEGRVRIASPALAGLDPVPPPYGELRFAFEYLVGEFDTSTRDLTVQADYDGNMWDTELDWEVRLPQTPSGTAEAGTTRLFFPVYHQAGIVHETAWTTFRALDMPAADAPYLKALYRVQDPGRHPVLLTAILPPDWESRPRYQRFVR